MATRNPRNLADAFGQIAKAADELRIARARYQKAARFLLNYGNTPAKSSPEFHYSNGITSAFRQHFTGLTCDLITALEKYETDCDEHYTEDA